MTIRNELPGAPGVQADTSPLVEYSIQFEAPRHIPGGPEGRDSPKFHVAVRRSAPIGPVQTGNENTEKRFQKQEKPLTGPLDSGRGSTPQASASTKSNLVAPKALKSAYAELIDDAGPITIMTGLTSFRANYVPVGRIDFVAQDGAAGCTIEPVSQTGDKFHFRFTRAAGPSSSELHSPEDIAVIARGFLLAKATVLRTRLSEALHTLRQNQEALRRASAAPDHAALPEDATTVGFVGRDSVWAYVERLSRLRAESGHAHRDDDARQRSTSGRLAAAATRHLPGLRRPLRRWSSAMGGFARSRERVRLWTLEVLARGSRALSHRLSENPPVGLFSLSTGYLVVFMLATIWKPLTQDHGPALIGAFADGLPFKLAAGLIGLAYVGVFLLITSNFRGMADKLIEENLEAAADEIARVASHLMHTNANVAALYVEPAPSNPYVSETLLRHLDAAMQTKATVASLGNVIASRERMASDRLKQIREHQQRARQAVTAAGGGVFVGFFTYEVGESVLRYMHSAQRADDSELQYWLFTTAGIQAHPDLQKARNEGRTEIQSSRDLESHYLEAFHHHQMLGQATLLSITLIVSLVAAWIGWRKPAEEQAGGHGGHH